MSLHLPCLVLQLVCRLLVLNLVEHAGEELWIKSDRVVLKLEQHLLERLTVFLRLFLHPLVCCDGCVLPLLELLRVDIERHEDVLFDDAVRRTTPQLLLDIAVDDLELDGLLVVRLDQLVSAAAACVVIVQNERRLLVVEA